MAPLPNLNGFAQKSFLKEVAHFTAPTFQIDRIITSRHKSTDSSYAFCV